MGDRTACMDCWSRRDALAGVRWNLTRWMTGEGVSARGLVEFGVAAWHTEMAAHCPPLFVAVSVEMDHALRTWGDTWNEASPWRSGAVLSGTPVVAMPGRPTLLWDNHPEGAPWDDVAIGVTRFVRIGRAAVLSGLVGFERERVRGEVADHVRDNALVRVREIRVDEEYDPYIDAVRVRAHTIAHRLDVAYIG